MSSRGSAFLRWWSCKDPDAPGGVVLGCMVVTLAGFAVLIALPPVTPVTAWPVVAVAVAVLHVVAERRRQPIGQGADAQVNLSLAASVMFAGVLLLPAAVMPLLVMTDFLGRRWRHVLVNSAMVTVPIVAAASAIVVVSSAVDGIDPAAEAMLIGLVAAVVSWIASAVSITVLVRLAAGLPFRESPVLRREATLVMWSQLLLGLLVAELLRISWWYLPLVVLAVWWAARYLAVLRRAVQADVDGRTGLLRYDVLRDAALREQERSRRTGTPHALVLVDIDELRSVNLARGYESGDAVIAAVASELCGLVRWQDVAARVGGEEFCVLVTGSTVEEGRALAEQLQARVRATAYDTPSGPVRVTVSAGVTDLRPHESLDDALARLDLALYDAKGAGLDSVRLRLD